MELVTTLLSFISFIGYIESARNEIEGLKVAMSLFTEFEDNYRDTVSNRYRCINLNDRISALLKVYRETLIREEMPLKDIENYLVFFWATLPEYNLRKPTAEWIFSNAFVQFSAIQTMFSLTVGRLYNLYALETPNIQQAEDCAKVVSYLNAYRSIAIRDRLLEINDIYRLTADEPSATEAVERLATENSRGFSSLTMLSVQDKLFRMDDLLDRFNDIIGVEGTQRIPPDTRDRSKETAPLQMHLDFYTDANMDPAATNSYKSIKDSYFVDHLRFQRGRFSYNEAFRNYYYKEALNDIFYVFFSTFLPVWNYFNAALSGNKPVTITSGVFDQFMPPIDRSFKVWDKAHELRRIIEWDGRDYRSKIIRILREVLMANAPVTNVIPAGIQLTYKSERGDDEPDFFVDFK